MKEDLATADEQTHEQTYAERLQSCKKQIEAVTDFKPDVVLVLGTGLGDFADTLNVKAKISYKDIDGWPNSTAPKHAGNLIFAEYNGLKLVVMQGRVHYYEGYSMQEVVLPLRVLHLLGADTVILTNASPSLIARIAWSSSGPLAARFISPAGVRCLPDSARPRGCRRGTPVRRRWRRRRPRRW